MKSVYKCDYCSFMGTEEEVAAHEPTCMDNYDKRSCYTCAHRGKLTTEERMVKYECEVGKDIPRGHILEFCPEYERKEKPKTPCADFLHNIFGCF